MYDFSRTKVSSHQGFDERLCYGDITLGFAHDSQQLSKTERRRVEKIRQENEVVQEKHQREGASVSQMRK